jgi:DDE domain
VHRQVKYLNNIVEADHGKLKKLIRPTRGFETMKTAYATIKGFEVMRALRKGQAAIFNLTGDVKARGAHRRTRLRHREQYARGGPSAHRGTVQPVRHIPGQRRGRPRSRDKRCNRAPIPNGYLSMTGPQLCTLSIATAG